MDTNLLSIKIVLTVLVSLYFSLCMYGLVKLSNENYRKEMKRRYWGRNRKIYEDMKSVIAGSFIITPMLLYMIWSMK